MAQFHTEEVRYVSASDCPLTVGAQNKPAEGRPVVTCYEPSMPKAVFYLPEAPLFLKLPLVDLELSLILNPLLLIRFPGYKPRIAEPASDHFATDFVVHGQRPYRGIKVEQQIAPYDGLCQARGRNKGLCRDCVAEHLDGFFSGRGTFWQIEIDIPASPMAM